MSSGDLAGVVIGSFFGGVICVVVVGIIIAALVALVFKYRFSQKKPEVWGANYVSMKTKENL